MNLGSRKRIPHHFTCMVAERSFGFIPRCSFLVTCLVPLTHAMAAAFNAQMGLEELVVQLNLMHAEVSRWLQTNEAEHQRLWVTIEETKSEVGNPRREAEQRATQNIGVTRHPVALT